MSLRKPPLDSHAMHADGLLLTANGVDSVTRWDGLASSPEDAGVLAPTVAPTIGSSGTGSLSGTYYAYERFLDKYRNPSNLSPLSGSITPSSAGQIDYTSVQVPTESKVVYRQILRNTDGQTAVFYVDVETTDLVSTTFSSTNSDADLQAEEAVALFDDQDRLLANLHAPPPDDRGVLAAHLDRMFLAGEEVITDGCISITNGSATVQGIGTDWKDTFVGRFLWVDGGDQPYEISAVSEADQTLTLTSNYAGTTSPYALYAIRPALPRRRLVFFSEAGQPESWPTTNAVSVQEDSDEITALMPKGSFLYILCRRHTYRITFQDDPTQDGFVFFATGRGCVNKRSWVLVDETAYLMDEAGIYSLGGGQDVQDVSLAIQDLFETGPARLRPYKIHWAAARYFHAVYDPGQKVVRWFVTLSGQDLPRHALCLDLGRQGWWIEEFPFAVSSSCVFRLSGEPRVALGGPGGVYLMNQGNLDLVDPQKGSVRGTVSASSPMTLTDEGANFASDCVGAPVKILSGTGKGQTRRIVGIGGTNNTTLTLKNPWTTLPDSTSIYQIGGVAWKYRTGWFRFSMDENDNPRRLEVVFEPTQQACSMTARVYLDRSREPVGWAYEQSSAQSMGFASQDADPDLLADLSKSIGLVQRRLDGHKEYYIDGPRFVQVELAGDSNRDPVSLYEVNIDGAVP